jgi:hypothetical protein
VDEKRMPLPPSGNAWKIGNRNARRTSGTLYARGESTLELFLRNRDGKVSGMLYTTPYGEIEATRLTDVREKPVIFR